MNTEEFISFIVMITISACFGMKCINQNDLKTKQMQTDCIIQTQSKDCLKIGSQYGQAI